MNLCFQSQDVLSSEKQSPSRIKKKVKIADIRTWKFFFHCLIHKTENLFLFSVLFLKKYKTKFWVSFLIYDISRK